MLWPGPPSRVYRLVKSGHIRMLGCVEGEAELARVLADPKFNLPGERVQQVMSDVRQNSIPLVVTSTFSVVADDPTDDVFVRLAVDGDAQYLVSGDRHLLKLVKYQKVEIVTAAEFLKRYEASLGSGEPTL